MTFYSNRRQFRAALILVACLNSLASRAEFRNPGTDAFDIRRDATVEAVEQVMPSVVNIATKTLVRVNDPFEEWYRHLTGQPDSYISLGSGVVIDEAGYLLTNDHVVRRADLIGVRFASSADIYEAKVVASDPKTDVALLKLLARPGEKFHAIKIAPDDDLLLGETVLALGNPFGLGGSVTRGILSSKSRSQPKENEKLGIWNWLQTDAPINPGNSGGPLVNLRGQLIGLNVAVMNEVEGQTAQGIGFAIPMRLVDAALGNIFPSEFVESWWFGARVKVGSSPLVLTSVQSGSPADRAGLKTGDALLLVNGKPPRNFIHFNEALAANPTTAQTLTVQRGTERLEATVRLVPTGSVFNADMIRRRLGLSLEPVTNEIAARYGVKAGDGFVVTGVMKDSPAEVAGLQNGILVAGVNGQTPANLVELAKLLNNHRAGEAVHLDVGVLQQVGSFNVLRPIGVDVSLR